jgi:hypothetical protein
MYSPKIRENLIPRIYRAAKGAGIAMTTWVNQRIETALPEETEFEEQQSSTDQGDAEKKLRRRG